MEKVELSRIVERLESGSREKGGSIDSGIVSIGGTHLSNSGGFKWEKKEFVSEDFYLKMRSGKIKQQDILIVKDGATTGKISFVDEKFPHKDAVINEHVFRVEINQNQANSKYVFYFLHSPIGQEQILNDFRGATVGGISRGFIDKVLIPLPDLETQNKIVTILDKAKAILDKREQTIARYNELLRATFLEMFGDPIKNVKGFPKVTVEEISEAIKDGPHISPNYVENGTPILSTRNIRPGKYISNDLKFVSQETYKKLVKYFKPEKGDVIITKGGTTGFAKVIDWDFDFCIWVHLAVVRLKSEINPYYFEVFINSDYGYYQTQRYTHGIANKDLGLKRIAKIELLLPPKELQNKFGLIYFKIAETISRFEKAKHNIEKLIAALSQLAFEGKLKLNTAVDLEVLLENDYEFFKENSSINSIQLLLKKLDKDDLNEKKFYEQDVYDKAKGIAFELLKDGKIKQLFDKKSKRVKLTVL